MTVPTSGLHIFLLFFKDDTELQYILIFDFSEYWGSTQKRLSYCTAKKHTNKHSEIF